MTRTTCAVASRARRKKILKMASGYRGRSKNCFRIAKQRVEKALQYAYRDRRTRKRMLRRLWIQRINAAARLRGLTYARFMGHLRQSGVLLDRKILSDLAVHHAAVFDTLCQSPHEQ